MGGGEWLLPWLSGATLRSHRQCVVGDGLRSHRQCVVDLAKVKLEVHEGRREGTRWHDDSDTWLCTGA